MDIYYSSDFQCPDTGIPVVLIYDEAKGRVTAEICWSLRHMWEELDIEHIEDLEKETDVWCKQFCKVVENLDEANDIANKYDCWFR